VLVHTGSTGCQVKGGTETLGRERRRTLRVMAGLLVLLLAGAMALPAGARARTPLRGVMLHSLWWESSDAVMARELALARLAGSNVVRVDVGWGTLEDAGKGRYAPWYVAKLDRFVAGAAARGMKVLPALWGTPCWASTAPEALKRGCAPGWWARGVAQYPPHAASDYGDTMAWLVGRYGDRLAAVEVWNEPNLATRAFWNGTPGQYVEILRAAQAGARSSAQAVPVLAGALAGSDGAYLRALYAAGAQGLYDGLAVHPYADPGFARLGALRRVQLAAGDDKPIWVTEFGWPTGVARQWHVSEAAQAYNVVRGFQALDRLPWVQGAVLYNLRDKGTNRADVEHNLGVLRRSFAPKPAFAMLRAVLTGSDPFALRLSVRRVGYSVYAHGVSAPRALVSVRLSACSPGGPASMAVRASAYGNFARRLGPAVRLRGCRVTVAAATPRRIAVSASVR